jgi:hypothetical protein
LTYVQDQRTLAAAGTPKRSILEMSRRTFFLALTVKNEAPNIWEWVAYHRAIGFTDIVIYQNDSVDGTQALLRTMAEAGFIQYFPNPCRFKA